MKILMISMFAVYSLSSFADGVCNLKKNDRAVIELNERFDQATMSGEDHAIGLKHLYEKRLKLIKKCVERGQLEGITKEELEDVLLVSKQDK